MTKRLDQAIAEVRKLPAERQDEAAELLFGLARFDADTLQLTPEQAAEVERRLIASMVTVEEAEARAEAIASCYVERGQMGDCLSSRWQRYEAVTSADVVRVAQEWLRPERRSILTIVPIGDDHLLPESTLVELP